MSPPDQVLSRYPHEIHPVASTSHHNPSGLPRGRLAPLDARPSSPGEPITLPSFNHLASMIPRGTSPLSDRGHLTHPPQNGPGSARPRLSPINVWKAENGPPDQQSAGPALPGQQLNVPAPSLPPSYPGMHLLLGDTQRKSRVETQIKQVLTLEFNGERVTRYHYIHVPPSASVKKYKTPPKNVPSSAILTLEALAIPSSYPAVQAFCCRTCYSREAKRKPEAYPESLPQNLSPIDFACSEYLDFNSGTAIVPFRIICYSRHHSEKDGFNVRLILRNHQKEVVAAVQTPPIMITDDRKAVKRSIAAAEANGTVLGLPVDRKRTVDHVEGLDETIMPRQNRPRTSSYASTLEYPAGPSSSPYKAHKPHPALLTQPAHIHPSLALVALASLEGIFPNRGPVKGGIQVAVTGVHLTHNSTVSFGGVPVANISFKCDKLMICVLPKAQSAGSVPVSLGGGPTDPSIQFPTFTYESEESDSGMISTALTVLAFRETGKWENAVDVANRVLASNASDKRMVKEEHKNMYSRNGLHETE